MKCLFAALLVLLFWRTPPASAAVETPNQLIPVWLSPELNLRSPAMAEGELNKNFSDAPDGSFSFTTKNGDELEKSGLIRNCKDYLERHDQIYSMSQVNSNALNYQGTRCATLDILRNAKPAKQSGFKNFLFDQHAVKLLPPQFGDSISLDDERKVATLNARHKSFFDYDPSIRLKPIDTNTAILKSRQGNATITLMARGDFDGSGWEQLLVRVSYGLDGGTLSDSRLFQLARQASSGPVYLVKEMPCSYQDTRSCSSLNLPRKEKP